MFSCPGFPVIRSFKAPYLAVSSSVCLLNRDEGDIRLVSRYKQQRLVLIRVIDNLDIFIVFWNIGAERGAGGHEGDIDGPGHESQRNFKIRPIDYLQPG